MKYKLGKLPARVDAVKLKLADYTVSLPVPTKAGHYTLVSDWEGMLGNDQFGDCVWAGADHEHILWNKEADKVVSFTPSTALADYSAVTGFNPSEPDTDNGTDMQVAASYRLKTGVADTLGKRHQIGAYVALKVGSSEEIKQAIYYFGLAGIGIQFPASAMTQFNQGKNWTVVKGSKIEGGHYIPIVGYDSRYVYLVTWGKVIKASWGFITKYMDEGIAYLSSEMLSGSKSLDGFNINQLKTDLGAL